MAILCHGQIMTWYSLLRLRDKRCCRRSCWCQRKGTHLLEHVQGFGYWEYSKV